MSPDMVCFCLVLEASGPGPPRVCFFFFFVVFFLGGGLKKIRVGKFVM